MHCPHTGHSRREFVGLLGLGLAGVLTGCSGAGSPPATPGQDPYFTDPSHARRPGPAEVGSAAPGSPPDPAAPGARPPGTIPPDPDGDRALGRSEITGRPQTLHSGPPADRRIAVTIDDGFCAACVAGYVSFARTTGIHLTFSPNGIYAREWGPHAPVLRPLIESGQIQIMNHTYDHKDLTVLTPAAVGADLERNEAWITTTFGTGTRPYYRPPFGRHNAAVADAAAAVGYHVTTLWNGSYSDSTVITPDFLMSQARKYLQPGTIMIGHANHPAVLGLFGQIVDLIKSRNLHPVTLDEMFGTTRPRAKH